MQINKGDLLLLKRSHTNIGDQAPIHALVVIKTKWDETNCECKLLINMLERMSHVFIPAGRNWTKTKVVAHIFAPSRKEQKEKGVNIGNVWGDYDVIQIIKGENTCTSTDAK